MVGLSAQPGSLTPLIDLVLLVCAHKCGNVRQLSCGDLEMDR